MPTLTPSAAMHEALAAYLQTKIAAVTGLADSLCLTRWPEPTVPLQLSPTKVVLGLTRTGPPTLSGVLGGGKIIRTVPGVAPAATFTVQHDEVTQPFSLDMWAISQRMRDEVDEILFNILSVPFWTSISPVVSTTLSTALKSGQRIATATIPSAGLYTITPASMTDIWPGTVLRVEPVINANTETVKVIDIKPSSFTAMFLKSHAAASTLVELAGRRNYTGAGGLVYLRCALHFNGIAGFMFGEPSYMDNEGAGRQGQMQEWRSVRLGTGTMQHLSAVSGAMQQRLYMDETITSSAGVGTTSVRVF